MNMNGFFQKGQTVLFQGDSVTDCTRSREDTSDLGHGYAKVIADVYNTLYSENEIKFVNRGVSGNRVRNLLERYDNDLKAINPDFISILIGINDTWRRFDQNDETNVTRYETEFETLLKQIKKDLPKAKIMIIEPFLIDFQEHQLAWREDLDPKIHAARRLATKYADYYLPTDGIFAALKIKGFDPATIAADGVHPTPFGHSVIAQSYLKALQII